MKGNSSKIRMLASIHSKQTKFIHPQTKSMLAGLFGTVLEWYDFAIYGYLAAIISQKFFTISNRFSELLLSYSVFAMGFLIRPIGAVFFGHLGDKYGRKKTLISTILLMTVSTFLIGFLPTYEKIGLLAPIMLTILRMTQGFSAGGEFGGAVSLVFESSTTRKGFFCACICAGSCFGILMCSIVMAVLSNTLDAQTMNDYGWRIPFFLSIITGIASLYLRLKITESEEFIKAKSANKLLNKPIIEVIKKYKLVTINLIGLYALCSITIYLLFVFMPVYLSENFQVNLKIASASNTIAMIVFIIFIPLYGWVSDKINGLFLMGAAILLLIIFSYPLFTLLADSNFSVLIVQILFALIVAAYHGSIIKIILSQLPVHVRYTTYAVGYNISYSLFGGFTPLISLALIDKTGNVFAPAFYLIFGAMISFSSLLLYLKKVFIENKTERIVERFEIE